MYIVRVMGTGKLMIICKESEISIINARTNEKTSRTWEEISKAWDCLWYSVHSIGYKEVYKELYGIDFPEKEVAPVQLEKKETPKPKTDNKKVKTPAKPVKKEESKEEIKTEDPKEAVPEEAEVEEKIEKLDEESVEVIHPEEKSVFDDEDFINSYNEWLRANDNFILNVRKRDKSNILTNLHTSIVRAEKMRAMLLHKEYEEE